ncbi:hypothetical protein CEQ14_13010 (plasmid) [Staphylococcus saprophyticus]|nr:hypothetical protein CEQ14_13010 [Staphylococcus saprophyticus]
MDCIYIFCIYTHYGVIIHLTKASCIYAPNPSLLGIVRGFLLVWLVSPIYLSLRLRSQYANKVTIQPLMTVVVM